MVFSPQAGEGVVINAIVARGVEAAGGIFCEVDEDGYPTSRTPLDGSLPYAKRSARHPSLFGIWTKLARG